VGKERTKGEEERNMGMGETSKNAKKTTGNRCFVFSLNGERPGGWDRNTKKRRATMAEERQKRRGGNEKRCQEPLLVPIIKTSIPEGEGPQNSKRCRKREVTGTRRLFKAR